MKAYVVYESHWGHTAAVAQAIAAGIGSDARAVTTDELPAPTIADADLIVAGAPVIAFGLPSERMLEGLAVGSDDAPAPPDLSHPSMREWLRDLPEGHGRFAGFETAIHWSPGGAISAIGRELERAGYAPVSKPRRFFVKGKYGPLREGELDRARAWGAELASKMAN